MLENIVNRFNKLDKKIKLYILSGVLLFIVLIFVYVLHIAPNRDLEKNKKVFFINVLLNVVAHNTHNLHGETTNKIEYQDEGHYEVPINSNGYAMNYDLANGGQYNHFSPIDDPLNHFSKDIFTWMQQGKSKFDPTTREERVIAYTKDFVIALDFMRQHWGLRVQNVEKYLQDKQFTKFFVDILSGDEFKEYNFSRTDKWLKDDKEYKIFRDKIERALVNSILNFSF